MDAEKHSRMLSKLGGLVKATKFRSMPEVVSFVQEAQEQLAVLRADEGLVVSQLTAWPKQRYCSEAIDTCSRTSVSGLSNNADKGLAVGQCTAWPKQRCCSVDSSCECKSQPGSLL